ncbi:MAG TPA: hypothetical protein VEI02_07700 [Planctomycetota bacterium]|nr:hypothetical protein [Planctomycetota bacterium]
MTRRSLACVVVPLLALGVSCGGPSAPDEQGGGAVLVDEHPAAMRTPGRLELGDLSARYAWESAKPEPPYVEGVWIGGWFDPTGDVVGATPTAPQGRKTTRGRLELRTRAFFRQDEARLATGPCVDGWRDDDTGGFYPATGLIRAGT